MRHYLLLASMLLTASTPIWGQIEDDIYYNPKKAEKEAVQERVSRNYIADFQDMDVDDYNLRGQYYASPVDTIGMRAETDQDFVYTTQIQKYYNPTIVLDNVDLLTDVIANSYGNVNVEFNINGIPSFGPYVSYLPTAWGNWYLWNSPGWSISWGWNGPWSSPWWGGPWNWGYGPSWGWGPGWGWGWGPGYPSWGWGPSWGPSWGCGPLRPHYHADYRPGGNRPVGVRPGWGDNTRPGGNYNGGRRPVGSSGASARPGNGYNGTSRPSGGYTIGAGGHRMIGQGTSAGSNRVSSGSSTNRGQSGTGTVSTGGHRTSASGAYRSNSGTTTQRRGTTTQRRNNSSSGNNSSVYNRSGSGSYNTGGHRSTSSGGFRGGGSSRGGGGGGSRGGHR